jgi:Mitotic checkpoint regulator, MAD2B-interacting
MQAGQHIEFKEINAEEIQRAAPHEKSEIEALRIAMGSEHAKELQQATASATGPTKRQKQRHQITSLYHHAKATELQDMQRKQSNNRSKAVTQAKYGW